MSVEKEVLKFNFTHKNLFFIQEILNPEKKFHRIKKNADFINPLFYIFSPDLIHYEIIFAYNRCEYLFSIII